MGCGSLAGRGTFDQDSIWLVLGTYWVAVRSCYLNIFFNTKRLLLVLLLVFLISFSLFLLFLFLWILILTLQLLLLLEHLQKILVELELRYIDLYHLILIINGYTLCRLEIGDRISLLLLLLRLPFMLLESLKVIIWSQLSFFMFAQISHRLI